MIHDRPEDTDGYAGLYGEVVRDDVYKLRQLDFEPDYIFDLGANIGVFANFACDLFPRAQITCIEPDATNFAHLQKFATRPNIIALNMAVGMGEVYEHLNIPNGAHGCFLSPGVGYPPEELAAVRDVRKSSLRLVMPSQLIDLVPGRKTVLLKMDIEGNEHVVFSHRLSMEALRTVDYLCFELHRYALHGGVLEEARALVDRALASFEATHVCHQEHVMFYARKKK